MVIKLIDKLTEANKEIARLEMEVRMRDFRLETIAKLVDEALSKDASEGLDRRALELMKANFICFGLS